MHVYMNGHSRVLFYTYVYVCVRVCSVAGPMFLLPGYAIVMHITGLPVADHLRTEIIRYLSNMQSDEGGWGIHIESLPTVFGTALNYTVCSAGVY